APERADDRQSVALRISRPCRHDVVAGFRRMSRAMTRKARLYTPNQVALMSWLAPAAGVFALAKNFRVLGNKTESMMTLLCGGLFVVWLYGVIFFSEAPREVP